MSLALWLRAGRAHRGMSLDDVAKVTKIQPRILERLEAGKLEGLPAEVFVRGFVRSFARCVGLDEEEALRRYAACSLNSLVHVTGVTGMAGATGASSPEITPAARALVEAMADLVPGSAIAARATPRRMTAVEVIDLTAGSLRDLPSSRAAVETLAETMVDTVVETMMLPETGTVVVAPPPAPSLAEAPEVAKVATAPVAPSRVDDSLVPSSLSLKKKRGRRGKGRNKHSTGPMASAGLTSGAAPEFSRNLLAAGTPAEATPVVTAPASLEDDALGSPGSPGPDDAAVLPVACDAPGAPVATDDAGAGEVPGGLPSDSSVASGEATGDVTGQPIDEPMATAIWSPKMPPMAAAPSVPWRKPAYVGAVVAAPAAIVPSLVLVIDDADPDSAERIIEERAEKHTPRRSFLPPILLDREDRSARQGGLTLAVIILLIAATLTLSYLMRRPSAGGDGMTRLDTPSGVLDVPALG
jgi:helix-turn-helix protein